MGFVSTTGNFLRVDTAHRSRERGRRAGAGGGERGGGGPLSPRSALAVAAFAAFAAAAAEDSHANRLHKLTRGPDRPPPHNDLFHSFLFLN